MIKIFTIREILDATNEFLDQKKEKKGEFDLYQKPLILEDNISKVNKKNETYEVPKFTQQLIEEAEKVNLNRKDNLEKKEPLNKNKKNNIKNFSVNEKKKISRKKKEL